MIQRRKMGPPAVLHDLLGRGIDESVAQQAIEEVAAANSPADAARQFVLEHLGQLNSLDRPMARRRLAGMLARRGFDEEIVGALVDEFLPDSPSDAAG